MSKNIPNIHGYKIYDTPPTKAELSRLVDDYHRVQDKACRQIRVNKIINTVCMICGFLFLTVIMSFLIMMFVR